jgi:spermidine/putrescine transport system permease protein
MSGSGKCHRVGSRIGRLGWVPIVWYALFLLGPLFLVFATSLATRGMYGGIEWTLTGENYGRSFDPLFYLIVWRSFLLAAATALLCFVIGFPMALSMATATATATARSLFVFALAVPFLTNLMIRICAVKSLVAYDGPVAHFLLALGIGFDRFALSQNMPLVLYGMISSYLPFMVFPLYSALERFDFSTMEAAQDLGANYLQVMNRVILPSLRPAIVSGVLLVFIPAFGEFVIPDLLGGAKSMFIGNLISEQFLKARDWPFGSALSILLMLVLVTSIWGIRLIDEGRRHE